MCAHFKAEAGFSSKKKELVVYKLKRQTTVYFYKLSNKIISNGKRDSQFERLRLRVPPIN